jgi:hypothetical protein
MSNTTGPADAPNFNKVIEESEEDFFRAWNTPIGAKRRRPKKVPPESLITPEDRDVRGYDLWDDLVVTREFARPFGDRVPMQVTAGRYVCKPVIGQLQKVLEARGLIPYYLLVMVVTAGPHKGKIVPWYWPYPGKGDDDFWRDCRAAGIDLDHMDPGCGFAGGGLHVVVREVRKGKEWCCEVSSVTKLASIIPEAIWPTEADKPSVRWAQKRVPATRSAVAAAASLTAGGAVHENKENDNNEKVR